MAYDANTKTFTVSTDDELNAAIANIDAIGKGGNNNGLIADNYTIRFTQSITLDGTSGGSYAAVGGQNAGQPLTINSGDTAYTVAGSSQLYALNLSSGTRVTIDGAGFELNGGNTYNGFFVYNGQVGIQNLTIANTVAQGGNGSGGGAGLGGGLFVAGPNATAVGSSTMTTGGNVALSGVRFTNNAAKGGDGGDGGGGGLNGGAGASGGGGGVGLQAQGSDIGGNRKGGDGILLGAAPSGTDPYNQDSAPGLNGGGGGGFGPGGVGGTNDQGGVAGFGGGNGDGGGGSGGFGGGGSFRGTGGFGGGSGPSGDDTRLSGGFGAGAGSAEFDGGGGGLGAGADVFVQQGGALSIAGGKLEAGTVEGGAAGTGAIAGAALGSGLFIQGNQSVTLNPGAGQTTTVDGVIADVTGSVPFLMPGQGTGTGAGALVVGDGTSTGTVMLSAVNTYTGGTMLNAGTLSLNHNTGGTIDAAGANTGAITFATGLQTLRLNVAGKLGNQIKSFDAAAGDVIDLQTITRTGATLAATTTGSATTLTVTEAGASPDQNVLTLDAAPSGQRYALGTDTTDGSATIILEAIPPNPPTPTGPTPQADNLTGTDGADTISLLAGNDTYSGMGGTDLIYGNQGSDLIYGNEGRDTVYGGQGDDRVYGGQGNDRLYGNLGSDRLYGNLGNDLVYGNEGDDRLFGQEGRDTLYGGQDDDLLDGGDDADILVGGRGNDTLRGGAGADRYVFADDPGARDLVLGFSTAEGDRLDLGGQDYTVRYAGDGDAILTLSGGGQVRLDGVTRQEFGNGAGYFVG